MRRVMASVPIWCGVWCLALMLGLSGCATVGVSRALPVSENTTFEKALMAFAGGDVEQASAHLTEWLALHPADLRAQALAQAIDREQWFESEPLPPLAQMPPSSEVSPETLLQSVLWRNPDIRRAIFQVIEARAALREANVSFSPEFLVLSRFYPSGIFIRLTQSILGALLERQALMDETEAELLAAVARYAQVRDATLHQAVSTYVRWLESQAVVPVLRQAVETGEELERVGAVLDANELLAQAEFLAIRQEVNDLRRELVARQGHIRVAEVTLKGLMARAADESIRFTHAPLTVESPEAVAGMVAAALERHPQLVEARGDVTAATARKDRVFWNLPKVDLRATYGDSAKQGRGDFIEDFSIGGRIRFPLLLWPLQRAKSDREQAFIDALEMEVLTLRHEVTVNIFQGYEDLQAAQSDLQTLETELQKRQAALKALQAQGELGEEGSRLALLRGALHYWEGKKTLVAQSYAIQRAQLNLQHAQGQALNQLTFGPAMEEEEDPVVPASLGPAGASRGLWVWKPDFLNTAEQTKFFVDFAEARRISTVFLSTSTKTLKRDPARFQRFLRVAHVHGLTVHALNGEPGWMLPQSRRAAAAFFSAIHEFNRSGDADARFDGIHLDVEPHAMPAWKSARQPTLVAQFVEFLAWAQARARESRLPFIVDVPDWYDHVPAGSASLLDNVVPHVDQIAVMAYRRNVNRLMQGIQEEVRLAQQHRRKLWIGLSADRRHLLSVTKWEMGSETPLDASIRRVEAEWKAAQGLITVAIHDYHRYRQLLLGMYPAEASAPQAAKTF